MGRSLHRILDTPPPDGRGPCDGWTGSYLTQAAGGNDIVEELHSEAATQLNCLHVAFACPWKGGKEETHGKYIIQIPQGINECWVPAATMEDPSENRKEHQIATPINLPRVASLKTQTALELQNQCHLMATEWPT